MRGPSLINTGNLLFHITLEEENLIQQKDSQYTGQSNFKRLRTKILVMLKLKINRCSQRPRQIIATRRPFSRREFLSKGFIGLVSVVGLKEFDYKSTSHCLTHEQGSVVDIHFCSNAWETSGEGRAKGRQQSSSSESENEFRLKVENILTKKRKCRKNDKVVGERSSTLPLVESECRGGAGKSFVREKRYGKLWCYDNLTWMIIMIHLNIITSLWNKITWTRSLERHFNSFYFVSASSSSWENDFRCSIEFYIPFIVFFRRSKSLTNRKG